MHDKMHHRDQIIPSTIHKKDTQIQLGFLKLV